MRIKLDMSLFRQIKDTNYEQIYKSDYATYCYTALRYMAKNDVNITTTPNLIFNTLTDKKPTKTDITGIKKGLQELEKSDIINFEKVGTTYIIDTDNLQIQQTDKYFYINSDDIQTLMEQKNGIKLLHHYLLLCSTINVIEKFGNHDRKYFANALSIDEKTITRHHQLFCNLGIIFFSEHKNGINKKGEFVNLPKLYCMIENQDIISSKQSSIIKKNVKLSEKKKQKSDNNNVEYENTQNESNYKEEFDEENPFGIEEIDDTPKENNEIPKPKENKSEMTDEEFYKVAKNKWGFTDEMISESLNKRNNQNNKKSYISQNYKEETFGDDEEDSFGDDEEYTFEDETVEEEFDKYKMKSELTFD